MAETEAEPEADTAEEVKSTLLSVVDRIAGAERGGSGDAPPTGGGSATLPVAIALLGVIVIGFSVLGVMLVMARRKAAKLAAQMRKLEEEKVQIVEDQKLAKNENERVVAETQAKAVKDKIEKANGQLEALKVKNTEHAKTLAAITDWDSLVVVDKRTP